MILSKLRSDLSFLPSPIRERPGLLIRDSLGYSDAILVIPPFLAGSLLLFDGMRTASDLHAELSRLGDGIEIGNAAQLLADQLSESGFLEDETYSRLKKHRHFEFAQSAVRKAAHAGTSYPADIDPLREVMRKYLGNGTTSTLEGMIGIAAPHASQHTHGKAIGQRINC